MHVNELETTPGKVLGRVAEYTWVFFIVLTYLSLFCRSTID